MTINKKKEKTLISFVDSLRHPEVYFDNSIDIRFLMPKGGRKKLYFDSFHLKECERKKKANHKNH